MADRVRFVMDRMAPLFKQLEQSGIFTTQEVKSIVQKRTDYEYTLMRFELTTNEIDKYLHYEKNLFQLFQLRYEKYKQVKKGELNRGELELFRTVKVALIQHIDYIYERSNKKFPNHFPFWFDHIQFLKENESYTYLDTLSGKVLALYPYEVDFWIVAGLYELQQKQNVHAARVMMQRGLRVNQRNHKLWKCYFDLEVWNYLRAIERQDLLIKKPLGTMTDANRKKIEEQKKLQQQQEQEKEGEETKGEGEGTVVDSSVEFDYAGEAPLLVVFKYACQALLGLEESEEDDDDDDSEDENDEDDIGMKNKKQKNTEEVVDFARGGLDLNAKLAGLEVLFAMHQASIILSPKLTKDMESQLRLVLGVASAAAADEAHLNAEEVTLINALMKHLVHLQVKKAMVDSKVFDQLATYQLHLHERKQQQEKEKMRWEIMLAEEEAAAAAAGNKNKKKTKKDSQQTVVSTEQDHVQQKELSTKVIQELVSIFQQCSHYVQELMKVLPTTSSTTPTSSSAAANKVLTTAVMMDMFATCFVNMFMEIYRETLPSSMVEVPKPEKPSKKQDDDNDGEEVENTVDAQDDEDALPSVDVLKELVRERVLAKINTIINPIEEEESSEDEDKSDDATLASVVKTVAEWIRSMSGDSPTIAVPPAPTSAAKSGKKGSSKKAAATASSSSLDTVSVNVQAQNSWHDIVKTVESLLTSSEKTIMNDDVVKNKISFLVQLEHHRIFNTSVFLLSQLLSVTTDSSSLDKAIESIDSIGKKLLNIQERMPLGESVKEEVIEVVDYWSQLVMQLMSFDRLSVDHVAVIKMVQDISPLLTLNGIGESLLRHIIGNSDDEIFFESVCHRIITNVRLVKPTLRMQWVMVYIENSIDDLPTLQKSYDWVMGIRKKQPQLFAAASFDDFMTFVMNAVDELTANTGDSGNSNSGSKKRDSSSVSDNSFLQKVLETAVQDCGLHTSIIFTDRLVDIYRQQGQHAKANHVLFKRRRTE